VQFASDFKVREMFCDTGPFFAEDLGAGPDERRIRSRWQASPVEARED